MSESVGVSLANGREVSIAGEPTAISVKCDEFWFEVNAHGKHDDGAEYEMTLFACPREQVVYFRVYEGTIVKS